MTNETSTPVTITHYKALDIISNFKNQITIHGSVSIKTAEEKAILLDSLILMENDIHDDQRHKIVNQRWNDLQNTQNKK